jgi:hypothetical protein
MSLHLINLDARTRALMLQEIDSDITGGILFLSQRLSLAGQSAYPGLLIEAIKSYDDSWLANSLRINGRMRLEEQRRKPKGGYTFAKVPINAPDTLAEGEFNRFYIRGLCLRAAEDGITELVIYRAKDVQSPRRESEAMIGTRKNAALLLQDIRTHPGVDTALRLPPGPNSGLSVRLP